jgi:transportin-3
VLHRINTIFQQELHQASNSKGMRWQEIESCLACVCAIYQFIPKDESEFLPLCFSVLPQLPPDVTPLRFTASKLIGKFASWLSTHTYLLTPLMPFLAQGLSIKECAPAAAVAIKELCEISNESFNIGNPVFELYQGMSANPGRIELNDELQVLEGACKAVSRQVGCSRDSIATCLNLIIQPIGSRLAANVADPSVSPKLISNDVDRLTVIVRHFHLQPEAGEEHPILHLIKHCWDILVMATTRFPGDSVLAEKVCRLHKHAMRTCGASAYSSLVDQLIEFYVKSYERSHLPSYLYASSIIITEYAPDPMRSSKIFVMVAALATTTFDFLRTMQDYTNHPETVEEVFYLLSRMMTYIPDPLVTSPLLLKSTQCAIIGTHLDHPGANKGTMKFLENCIAYGLTVQSQNKPQVRAALESVITQEGPHIVSNLTRALMKELPSYSNQVPDILWYLRQLCPGLLLQWLRASLSSSGLSERLVNDFLGALESDLARDEFNLAIRAFESGGVRERRLRRSFRQ